MSLCINGCVVPSVSKLVVPSFSGSSSLWRMRHCLTGWVVPSVLEDHTTFVFKENYLTLKMKAFQPFKMLDIIAPVISQKTWIFVELLCNLFHLLCKEVSQTASLFLFWMKWNLCDSFKSHYTVWENRQPRAQSLHTFTYIHYSNKTHI